MHDSQTEDNNGEYEKVAGEVNAKPLPEPAKSADPLPKAFLPKEPGHEPCSEQRAVMEALGFRTRADEHKVSWLTTRGNVVQLIADETPAPAEVLAAIESNSILIGKRLQRQELLKLLTS